MTRNPARRWSGCESGHPAIDPQTGKWFPEHRWSSNHDLLYAKLCYSHLLFRSPRKSNYIISKGKQWFVDWATGNMVRVLPPSYIMETPETSWPLGSSCRQTNAPLTRRPQEGH